MLVNHSKHVTWHLTAEPAGPYMDAVVSHRVCLCTLHIHFVYAQHYANY